MSQLLFYYKVIKKQEAYVIRAAQKTVNTHIPDSFFKWSPGIKTGSKMFDFKQKNNSALKKRMSMLTHKEHTISFDSSQK